MAAETNGNQPSHMVNQGVGLLVFLGGVVLLALVFAAAYRLYQGIDAATFQVQPAQVRPVVPGLSPTAPPPGGLTGAPGGKSLSSIILTLVLKLLILVVMGWVGGIIASKGIGLAVGPPRPVDRGSG